MLYNDVVLILLKNQNSYFLCSKKQLKIFQILNFIKLLLLLLLLLLLFEELMEFKIVSLFYTIFQKIKKGNKNK